MSCRDKFASLCLDKKQIREQQWKIMDIGSDDNGNSNTNVNSICCSCKSCAMGKLSMTCHLTFKIFF